MGLPPFGKLRDPKVDLTASEYVRRKEEAADLSPVPVWELQSRECRWEWSSGQTADNGGDDGHLSVR